MLRAISLLKAFPPERPEREVSDLASEAGLSRSTTHRLLAALESEGLVSKDPETGRFRLGPATVVLGARALRAVRLRERIHDDLEALASETAETATLEVLSEGKMLILDEVLGGYLVGASPSLGTSWALHATSTGKALLAELPREKGAALLSPPLERFTARTIATLEDLEKELTRVRADGFATVSGELEEGYAAAGAVIRVPMREPHATISVGGPSARLTSPALRELGALVKARAHEISRRLGFESP